jgi:hypothetical protein
MLLFNAFGSPDLRRMGDDIVGDCDIAMGPLPSELRNGTHSAIFGRNLDFRHDAWL